MSCQHSHLCEPQRIFAVFTCSVPRSLLLLIVVSLLAATRLGAQQTVIATSGALKVPTSVGAAFPVLPVLGQVSTGSASMGAVTAYIGIDYVRMFSNVSTTVFVELPDTTIPVSARVRIPIIVRQSAGASTYAKVRQIELRFTYLCEVIDLLGVSEQARSPGECVATLTIPLSDKIIDTVWVEGISKLCSVTSTPLVGRYSSGIADRGRVEVVVSNGELRQDGHCVTDGSTRLVFANVGIIASPYPASSYLDVTLDSQAEHQGILRVLDLSGNEVQRRQIRSTTSGSATERFDVNQLASGAYTLHYVHERGVSSTTVLVYR
jgi:hypothetical protein